MPVILNTNLSDFSPQNCGKACAKPSAKCLERRSRNLTIGLINNMPDSALEATERQFTSLLDSASDGITIRLRLYSLPGVPRKGMSADRVREFYSSTEELFDTQLDGLIVTGREPLTPNLRDEPYWDAFTNVLDWARNNTYSTVWSCLAAHAAVLYEDDIRRIKSTQKYFGVFDCESVANQPLTAGLPSRFKIPHSRWNGLPEKELVARGYEVLSRAPGAGVDIFAKQHRSLFVFLQGHPEYESNTLLLEYQRDIGRFFREELATYPLTPMGYFDADSEARLELLRRESASGQRPGLQREASGILGDVTLESAWHNTATRIYRNWLECIGAQKLAELERMNIHQEDVLAGSLGSYVNEAALAARLEPS
jgi:homoserine O-succinyltransferase